MPDTDVATRRPLRWDQPFAESMTGEDVKALKAIPPFSRMDPARFPGSIGLDDLLANDTRIVEYRSGDLIVREGDYGHSAFLILEGAVRVTLEALPAAMLGRRVTRPIHFLRRIAQIFRRTRHPEQRDVPHGPWGKSVAAREAGTSTRVFLQDVPGVLNAYQSVELTAGQIFGEQAAMARTPRTATVFAAGPARLLEIRWQGLRDFMRHAPELKTHIDQLYRANSLEPHLRETPMLAAVLADSIPTIAQHTLFESYGDFEWHSGYRQLRKQHSDDWINAEPIIGEEGNYADGLILVRSGFARLSRRYGDGHRTLAYLGKGKVFGLEELIYRWKKQRDIPWQRSLRAVGYVDILRIPAPVVEKYILAGLSSEQISSAIFEMDQWQSAPKLQESALSTSTSSAKIPTDLLEFILDHRLMNGTQTMIIDLDRCTRCDDCVRACAATHDDNPRFVRTGPIHDRLQFAHACMHCVDPVCMIGCPTGAIGRDAAQGTIVINDLTCIGCGVCAQSCPYDNIRMVEIRDRKGQIVRDDSQKPLLKATKCDLCIDQWGGPACQRACPHDALVRIDMNNVSQLAAWTEGR